MSDQLRDKFYGSTIEERVEQVSNELAMDTVALKNIVSFGQQGFELSGDALTDYVRRHILALLGRGAKPVAWQSQGAHGWRVLDYGDKPEEIAEAIIEEWLEKTRASDPNAVWLVWFGLPHIYDPPPASLYPI